MVSARDKSPFFYKAKPLWGGRHRKILLLNIRRIYGILGIYRSGCLRSGVLVWQRMIQVQEWRKKVSKVKIIIGIMVTALLACGIVAGAKEIKYSITFKDDREVVSDAIAGFFERDDETELEAALDTKRREKAAKEKGVDAEFSIQLNEIGIDDLSILEGLAATAYIQNDIKNRQAAFGMSGTYAGMNADFSVYGDKDKLQLASSLLDGQVLELMLSGDLYEGLKNSPLFGSMVEEYESTEEGADLKENLKDFQDMMKNGVAEGGSETLGTKQEEIKNIFEELKDDMKVSKSEKQKFEVSGRDKKCQGYEVEISGDAVAKMAEDLVTIFWDTYKQNSFYQKYMQALQSGYAGYGELADSEEMLAQIKEEVVNFIKENISGIDMSVYVTHYGKLVSLELSTVVDGTEYGVQIDCQGGEAMYSNMKIGFTMEEDGQKSGISLDVTEEKDGSRITSEMVLKVKMGGMAVEVGSAELVYDTKSSALTGEIKAGKMLADISMKLEGEVKELTKDSLDIKLNSIKVEAEGTQVLDCSMEYSVKSVNGVPELEGTATDILTMDENDLLSLKEKLSEAIQALGMLGSAY